jgi:hypothetical protein
MTARGGRTSMRVDVTLNCDDESISPAAPSALSLSVVHGSSN